MLKLKMAAAAALLMFTTAPALAQADQAPFKPGSYWDVSGIEVKDGYDLVYARYVADTYSRVLDRQKAKGWIKGYHILTNEYPRKGEPNIYFVIIYDQMPSAEEQERRGAESRAEMKTTMEQASAASGKRAEYRTVGNQMLLREQIRR
jgi:hypothetical protein